MGSDPGRERKLTPQQSDLAIMKHFRNTTLLFCLVPLVLCGCALFFTEKHSLLTTVPANTSSPFTFTANLATSTRYITFVGLGGQPGNRQKLRITIINRGRSAFIAKVADGEDAPVKPNALVALFDDEIGTLTNSLSIPVWGIESRTS